jgi:LysM repeat protein
LLLFALKDAQAQKITTEAYIDRYRQLAVSEMERSGIPASITLAQGILESASGNSRLAVQSNNHFGIKCHDWEGKTAYHDDDAAGECFRHYASAEESFLDHTDFLMSRNRYAFLFDYKSTDYHSWAKGLRKAGYATDPNYPQRLIELIERYNLHRYDRGLTVAARDQPAKTNKSRQNQTTPKNTAPSFNDDFSVSIERYPVRENNRTEYIMAKAGDTYLSLANYHDLTLRRLLRYNDREETTSLHEGEIVYLQPKRPRAALGMKTHVLKQGETMRDISQKYGVRLKRLYYMNRMEEGSQPPAGTSLNLRRKKR